MSIVTPDGGLTIVGYIICALAVVLLLMLAAVFRKSEKQTLSSTQLVYCGTAVALAFLTSYIKVFSLPFGGSITLFSMLFICLIGYWYGVRIGLLTGLAYGILQFLQDPYVLSLFQVCCDYILAFAGLGLAGVFSKSKNGLMKGYLLGIFARGAFHSLGGYLFWMDYMPESFPQSLSAVYPLVYNYSFIIAEGVITLIVMKLPPVAGALSKLKQAAAPGNLQN